MFNLGKQDQMSIDMVEVIKVNIFSPPLNVYFLPNPYTYVLPISLFLSASVKFCIIIDVFVKFTPKFGWQRIVTADSILRNLESYPG